MKAAVRAQPGPSRLSTHGLTLGDKWCWSPNTPSPQHPPCKVRVLLQLGQGSWPGTSIMSPWGAPGILLDGKPAAMPQFHHWSLCQYWASLKRFLGTSNYGHSEMNISQSMTFASQGQHAALQHSKTNEPCV